MFRKQPGSLVVVGLLLLLMLTVGLNRPAQAAGFLIYDLTGDALGRASAITANPGGPSAVWFNPAGLSFLPGYQFSVSTVVANNETTLELKGSSDTWDTVPGLFFLPSFFFTAETLDWLHFGIGVVTPYGIGIEWPKDWLGREYIIKASMQTIVINPTVSFKVWRNISIGLGLQVVRGVVDLTNGLPEVVGGEVRIAGGAWGVGGNIGVLWRVFPDLFHVAVTYRSRVKLAFDGQADFSPQHEEFSHDLHDQGGKADLMLPDVLGVGFTYKPHPKVELSLGAQVMFWNTFEEVRLDFEELDDVVQKRNWKPGGTFRVGIEGTLPMPPEHQLKIRGGFIYDMNPSPKDTLSPMLPDATRLDFCLGIGYAYKWFWVDVGDLFSYWLPSESVGGQEGPEGTYKSWANLFGVTIGFKFGHDRQKASPPTTQPPASQPPASQP